jgi:hypothetical protein
MVLSKKGARRVAPKSKDTSTPKSKRSSVSLDDVRRHVAALPSARVDDKLRYPVSDLVFACNRLDRTAKRLRSALLEKSRLDPTLLDSFAHRIAVLEESEEAWQKLRSKGAPKELKKLRAAATSLRNDVVAALRHFCEDDDELQVRLNEIMEGDGDADLISDLKALAPLVDDRWESIARAALPRDRGDALRKLSLQLSEGRIDNETTPEAKSARDLRNKAFAYLLEAEQELRKCGRYAFRYDPVSAALFADPFTRRTSKVARSAPPAP